MTSDLQVTVSHRDTVNDERPWRAQGQRILLAMKRIGQWAQPDLARAIGTSQGTISDIVLGKVDGKNHLTAIAEALDVDVRWITSGDPPYAWEWEIRAQLLATARRRSRLDTATVEELRELSVALEESIRERDARIRHLESLLPQAHRDGDPGLPPAPVGDGSE